jgi:hypothetical protein
MNYAIAEELSIRKIEDTIFVLDRKNSMMHTFNDTGAFLWEGIQQNTPVERLCEMLTDGFELSSELARSDVAEFLNNLEKQHLISITM